MLHYAIVFLVIALIAALFGFGGIAAGAVEIARILFFVFVIMASSLSSSAWDARARDRLRFAGRGPCAYHQ